MRYLMILMILMFVGCSHQQANSFKDADFDNLMQNLALGWNEGDAKKAADSFTKDAIYTEPPDKQFYKGRDELFKFFGGNEGRKSEMKMVWHHLVFDEEKQIGMGEFTFEFGSKVHGMVIVKIKDGKISNWREYWYESKLGWERFTENNSF